MNIKSILFSDDLISLFNSSWVKSFNSFLVTNSWVEQVNSKPQLSNESFQLGGELFIVVSENSIRSYLEPKPESAIDKLSMNRDVDLALICESDNSEEQLKWMKLCRQINHLIPSNSPNTESDVHNLCIQYSESMKKGRGFDFNRYLVEGLKLADATKIQISNTNQRWKVYDDIGEYVDNLNCFSDFSNIVKTVASELITNALYNGKRYHRSGKDYHADRSKDFDLDAGEFVEITFGRQSLRPNEDYLWIFVTDPFGSIDRKTIVDSLFRAASERRPRDGSAGGAGLGMFILYEWCSAIHFIVEPQKSTTIACKLKISKRNRVFDSEKSSLHIHVRRP